MTIALKAIVTVPKDGERTEGGKYKYPTIEAVMASVHEAMQQAEIFVCPEILESKIDPLTTSKGTNMRMAHVKIKYSFITTDGSMISPIMEGEAFDSGDKAISKALSAAYKKCLIQTFCIPVEDAESDGSKSESKDKTSFEKKTIPKSDTNKNDPKPVSTPPKTSPTPPTSPNNPSPAEVEKEMDEEFENPFEPEPSKPNNEQTTPFKSSPQNGHFLIPGVKGRTSDKAIEFTPEGKNKPVWVPKTHSKEDEEGFWVAQWIVKKNPENYV
jgi:hypothetical protein